MANLLSLSNLELLFIAAVSITIAGRAVRDRSNTGAVTLGAFMLTPAVWSLAHLLAHVTPATTPFRKLTWLGIGSAAFLWILFVLAYVGRADWIDRRTVGLALVWPALVNAAIWVPTIGRFVGVDPGFSVWPGLIEETSALFWTHMLLSYGLFAAGTALVLVFVWRASGAFRRQALAVVAGMGVLWIGSLVSLFELFGAIHFHALPASLALMGVVFLWATTRGGLTDLRPVSTTSVLETMDAGVIAVDDDGRVVELTSSARRMLALPDGECVVGSRLDDLPVDEPIEIESIQPGKPLTGRIDGRAVEVRATHLADGAGTVYLAQDVTDRERRRTALERQNDRLDRVASIISHDLRNPLNVASGRLELAREDGDDENLAAVAGAVERMESIVEGTLTLAREGRTVDPATVEPISLATIARECWGTVDTEDVSLEVSGDATIHADSHRLRHVFENLYRNAIAHADGATTVRVGPLPDGFFVEDDGAGFSAEEESVFEAGYSTAKRGTGLGLSIVADVVDAHDWEIAATSSDEGGARFEVTGVERGEA